MTNWSHFEAQINTADDITVTARTYAAGENTTWRGQQVITLEIGSISIYGPLAEMQALFAAVTAAFVTAETAAIEAQASEAQA